SEALLGPAAFLHHGLLTLEAKVIGDGGALLKPVVPVLPDRREHTAVTDHSHVDDLHLFWNGDGLRQAYRLSAGVEEDARLGHGRLRSLYMQLVYTKIGASRPSLQMMGA